MFNLGNKIKEKRKLLMLTQQELANRCELTKGYISQLESDSVSPSLETLEIILEVLGTNISDFFKENDNLKVVFNKEEHEGKKFIRHERRLNTLERSFYLGDIDEENICASFNDGILNITVPTAKEKEKKIITIE